jgi:hypothetical protein
MDLLSKDDDRPASLKCVDARLARASRALVVSLLARLDMGCSRKVNPWVTGDSSFVSPQGIRGIGGEEDGDD